MSFRSVALALACLLATAGGAQASELTETIRDVLNDIDAQVDDLRVWKLRVRPSFRQEVVWTDNVFLNDKHEQPFLLTRVVRGNGQTTDPARLRRIQSSLDDFRPLESVGRVSDTVSRSDLGVAFVLPVNPGITKFLDVSELNVLTAHVRWHDYLDRNELDNSDISLRTDVFGLFSDLLEIKGGDRFWVRAEADYSRIEEPLDSDAVDLQQVGIDSVDFKNFERDTSSLRLSMGFDENRLDAKLAGSFHRLRIAERELRQAEYDRIGARAEVGYDLPWFQEKRLYAVGELGLTRPGDRVEGGVQSINDGELHRFVLGVDGSFFSRKISGSVEVGYRSWTSDRDSGASGDLSRAHGVAGKVDVGYKPFAARDTRINLRYERTNEVSAISNFNDIHRGRIELREALIPRTLDADVSFGFTRTDASEGPVSRRYSAGIGFVYHPFEQVDVSLRYTYRLNDSRDEIRIQSSFARSGRQYVFVSESNGDFVQNLLELAIDVRF